nr:TIGR00645 family protein [Brevundimonas lenta]
MERFIFMSRWLMAPFYVGLVIALGLLLVVFAQEVLHYVPLAFQPMHEKSSSNAILAVLSLVDITLAANLLLIVIFAGYENFVSRLDLDGEDDRPPWMGTVDFSALKIKLIASIVAISAIQLLRFFMQEPVGVPGMNVEEARWRVIIHLTFVFSGVLLALMDWLVGKTPKH